MAFLEAAQAAEKLRINRRISAETFVEMAKDAGTIILDARGQSDYEALRIKGSVNLPYTAMAQESLAKVIPDRQTRILIYCRNNLADASLPFPLPAKIGSSDKADPHHPYPMEFEPPQIPKQYGAGLNIPTYITLYLYGYHNVWELDPVVDPNRSVIAFESRAPAPPVNYSNSP